MGRASHVFNLDQVDGISIAAEPAPLELTPVQRIAHIENWVEAIRFDAIINHSDEGRAYYRPSTDEITMPRFESFVSPEHYYSTLAHELVHWTGSKHRLERATAAKGVDTATYAKEELVAELGAAFLCADFGIDVATRDDHVNYLASWLKALQNDKRLIVTAASQASKAADLLNNIANERTNQMREAA
jgi:antirestriction protein ArdC